MTEEDRRICSVCNNLVYCISEEKTSCKSCRSSFLTYIPCECGTYYTYCYCRTCQKNMYKCTDCDKWIPHKGNSKYTCELCEICKYNRLVEEMHVIQEYYLQYEFQINDMVLEFRCKCICNEYLNWMKWRDIDDKIILQCKNCNPSNSKFIYNYREDTNCWVLKQMNMTCENCNSITTYNNIYNTNMIKSFSLCENCNPSTSNLKYKWNGYTWSAHTKKVYNDKCNRHVWKLVIGNIDKNYKCLCAKCNAI